MYYLKSRIANGVQSVQVSVPKPIKIDFTNDEVVKLGTSKDLRYLYHDNLGKPYVRNAETIINNWFKKHINEVHPDRISWITNHSQDIVTTIKNPEIIQKALNQQENGHWSQTFIKRVSSGSGFCVIGVSLANLPGEIDGEFHQVTTIYYTSKKGDFFDKEGKLKKKWMEVK